MIRYVGLDVHKHSIVVCVVDRRGRVLGRHHVHCSREQLLVFAKTVLKRSDEVALEATTNTWPVVELLRPYVKRLVIGNPLKTKAIAEAKIKTDKVDAHVLAQLLRCDYLPEVWQPDVKTQRQRSLITHRTGLMTRRGQHKNRVQSLLGRLMIKSPHKYLWSKAGIAWLRSLDLCSTDRLMLESELRQLDQVERELKMVDGQLIEIARQEPRVRLLMTLPGVNYVVAIGLLAALGEIGRFRDGNHAASYLGLVPSTKQSGNKCFHGRITKAGNPQSRWLLTQACQHVARHAGPLGAFYRRLAKRKPRQVVIMALARKLVTIAYLMLKNNEPYRYAQPKLIAKKFTSLGKKARTERPGSNVSLTAKARDGLAAVYTQLGVTTIQKPEELSDGEQRMLRNNEVMDFVEELYTPSSPPKPAAPVKKK